MTLESTMIIADASEFMRNGDFAPTRLEAQRDGINMVINAKSRANVQSSAGLMIMRANKLEVMVTLTPVTLPPPETGAQDKIRLLLNRITAEGELDFVNGLKVAKLALKFRESKRHRKRIVVFVGSPINATEKELSTLGKKFKKDDISVDVINFGEDETNTPLLEAFMKEVNKNEGSHLVTIPRGAHFADSLRSSPVLAGPDGTPAPAGGGGFGDVDPEMDPELAMVLRVSAEEERQRLQALGVETPAAAEAGPTPMDDGMDADMRAALALSMQDMQGATGEGDETAAPSTAAAPEMMSEEDMIAQAIAMSMEGAGEMDTTSDATAASAEAAETPAPPEAGTDVSFLTDTLAGLEGVDMNDPELLAALAAAGEDEKDGEKKDGEKE